jgi:hypothetical protein
MTNLLKHHLISSLTGVSALVVISSAVANPSTLPVALAGAGSLLAGASIAKEASSKREQEVAEAARVSAVFSELYEQYKGVINPEQLCVRSNIDLSKGLMFLEALAANQNGQRIELQEGVFFRFPHTDHILDRLTANAAAWADSRVEPIIKENSALKQQLLMIQSAAVKAAAPTPAMATPAGGSNEDPWQNLIR